MRFRIRILDQKLPSRFLFVFYTAVFRDSTLRHTTTTSTSCYYKCLAVTGTVSSKVPGRTVDICSSAFPLSSWSDHTSVCYICHRMDYRPKKHSSLYLTVAILKLTAVQLESVQACTWSLNLEAFIFSWFSSWYIRSEETPCIISGLLRGLMGSALFWGVMRRWLSELPMFRDSLPFRFSSWKKNSVPFAESQAWLCCSQQISFVPHTLPYCLAVVLFYGFDTNISYEYLIYPVLSTLTLI